MSTTQQSVAPKVGEAIKLNRGLLTQTWRQQQAKKGCNCGARSQKDLLCHLDSKAEGRILWWQFGSTVTNNLGEAGEQIWEPNIMGL